MSFLAKLKSRKFLACVAGIVAGIAMVYGTDATTINTIAGAVTTLGSIVAYIAAEGKIDAAAVKEAVDQIECIVDTVQDEEVE